MNKDKFICKEGKCTLCKACAAICPKKCITYTKDRVNNEIAVKGNICINCGLCEKVCPVNNPVESHEIINCYSAWSRDDDTRKKSASGGVASELYKYEIKVLNGYIVGTSMRNNRAEYSVNSGLEAISDFQNSKYTLSDTNTVFQEIKELLIEGKSVTFVGVPCHVAGLKNYLAFSHINMETLFLVDLICHGCVSPEYLCEHIERIETRKHITVDSVSFRNPDYGTENYWFTLGSQGKVKYKKRVYRNDEYQVGYHKGIIYRNCCYTCRYADTHRTGDVTLADFSGVGTVIPSPYSNKKVSCVLTNTAKGEDRIKNLSVANQICMEERPLEEELNHEQQLHTPTKLSNEAIKFQEAYARGRTFDQSINIACFKIIFVNELKHFFMIEKIKGILSKIVPSAIKRRIKSVRNKL